MAKRVKDAFIQLHVDFSTGSKKLRVVGYSLDDDVDADVMYRQAGSVDAPRDLTGGELAGTLQAFLDACEDEAKSAEGIS